MDQEVHVTDKCREGLRERERERERERKNKERTKMIETLYLQNLFVTLNLSHAFQAHYGLKCLHALKLDYLESKELTHVRTIIEFHH